MTHCEASELLQHIEQHTARVGIIGLGYVGLPLAVEFAYAGFRVSGFDIDQVRIAALNKGICHINDVDEQNFHQALATKLEVTHNFDRLPEADVIIICVPTPLGKNKEPDVSHIMNAAERITQHLRRGQLILLESTTFPGTTEELLLPLFERRGLHVGNDYWLAFSPERIDPGNERFALRSEAMSLRKTVRVWPVAILSTRLLPVSAAMMP